MAVFPRTQGNLSLKVKDVDGTIINESSGGIIATFLQTKWMDFGDRGTLKYIDFILAELTDADRPELVSVTVEYKDNLGEEAQTEGSFSLQDLARFLDMRVTARYVRLTIQSDSVGVFWRLGALEVYGTSHGRRF